MMYALNSASTATDAGDMADPVAAAPSFLPIILVAFIVYFLMIRPQQKRYKSHQSMIQAVKKGDKVLTGGGIIGTVTRIDEKDDVIHVRIAESVTIQVARATLANVYTKDQDESAIATERSGNNKSASKKKVSGKKTTSANDN